MKEATKEDKMRFFISNLCDVIGNDIGGELRWSAGGYSAALSFLSVSNLEQVVTSIKCDEDVYLKLTSFSQITDEDAIEVARMIIDENVVEVERSDEWFVFKSGKFKYRIAFEKGDMQIDMFIDVGWEQCHVCLMHVYKSYQYLKSKGYALPYMGWSVEDLIEMGWIKLKTVD